jgi:hypothetical protein
MRGTVIVATGHPYYGRMAYNLACTIKACDEDAHITVAHSSSSLRHLGSHQIDIFNGFAHVRDELDGFSPKLHLDELSPYEETLYLDADMLWLPFDRSPRDLMDEMANEHGWSGITEGWCEVDTLDMKESSERYYYWADVRELREKFALTGRMYQWRSEVIWFRRDAGAAIFERARRVMDRTAELKTVKRFGTAIPDELALNVALAQGGVRPHRDRWTPAYWPPFHGWGRTVPAMRDWYLMSFGGHVAPSEFRRSYDNICKVAHRKLGRQHLFGLHSKTSYLPDRQKI